MKQERKFSLYIIATPIGNLEDITLRALRILKSVDIIFCEDTRVTAKLLQEYQINKKLLPYHDHNEEKTTQEIINYIHDGKVIALVSDAGTPLISDPGHKLIKALKKEEIEFTTLPGPSSVIAALTLSGLPVDQFFFGGFLPNKEQARNNKLEELNKSTHSLIFFESANRLLETLQAIEKFFGLVQVSVVREISKLFEEAKTNNILELIKYYTLNPPRGEVVVIISPNKLEKDFEQLKMQLVELLKKLTVKDAVELISQTSEFTKKEIYQTALDLKAEKL